MAENTFRKEAPKKPKAKKENRVSEKKRKQLDFSFFKDPRFKLSSGWFLILSSLWLLISFVSYLFHGQADQSIVLSQWQTDIHANGQEVKNAGSLIGATIAHIVIYRWFGIGAIALLPMIGLYGYQLAFSRVIPLLKKITIVLFFSMLWLSIALGYFAQGTKGAKSYLNFICGEFGFSLAQYGNNLSGFGTIIFLILSLGIFIVYFFDIKGVKPADQESDVNEEETERIDESNFGDETDAIREVTEAREEEVSAAIKVTDDEQKEENNEALAFELETVTTPPRPVEAPSTELIVEEPKEEKILHELKVEEEPLVEEEGEIGLEVEKVVEEETSREVTTENYDPTLDLPRYEYPTVELLQDYSSSKVQVTREELEANKDKIVNTLGNYKIGIQSIKATIGPTVTLYEIIPEAGVKISKIKNLEDDIALSLAALGIRIIAPIPGKGTIGIEVPNKNREMVSIRSVMSTEKFMKSDMALPVVLGKTISNDLFMFDLAKMPHILMAGATGQGKSVGLNVLLASLLYKKHPSQLKFVLVDPKKVELSIFSKIENHFLAKLPDGEEAIITDTTKVIHTLNSLCIEMDTRYDLLKNAGCRNLKEYNKKFAERKLNPNKGHNYMPYIVVVIDELADLMMTAGKEVETPIARLAQLARAIGIHLVIATQRPSVNVITGIIKANFPARVSFRVTSKIDSRTILDAGGADQLVGMGDLLFSQGSDLTRVQCAFIDTPEVDAIVDFIGDQQGYSSAFMLPEYVDPNAEGGALDIDLNDRDPLFDEAARVLVAHQQGSTSLIQRKMSIGYNRAGRIIDQLEAAGIVGPFEGSKAREVLVPDELSLEQVLRDLNGL